jgi:copper transport protein
MLTGTASPAAAHDEMLRSTPAAHAMLPAGDSPHVVSVAFDEPTNAQDVRLRVLGPGGSRLDRGLVRATRSGGIGVRLSDSAPDGTYAVGWRAVARDGHVTSGTFDFTVGKPTPAPVIDPDELEQLPAATRVGFAAARALQYTALALAFGTMLFGLVTWRAGQAPPAVRERFARRSRWLLVAGTALGALSAAGALACEAASLAGTTPWSSTVTGVVWDSLTSLSNATCVWALVFAGWLAALALWLKRPGGLAAIVMLDVLVVSPAFCGHAAGSALAPAVAVHVLAMAAWVGGLVALLVAWRTAAEELGARERLPLLAGTVERFSRLALPAATAVFATGALQALVRLDGVGHLLDTGYGRLVLFKLLLFSGLLALAARNRVRLAPRLRAAAVGAAIDASLALRAAVGAEVALAVLVLAATGVLAGTAPPT